MDKPAVSSEEHGGDILVVDDSATSRTWARLQLERAGHHVRMATSAKEALATIATLPPDLILLDVVLPDLDGFEVTRRLRQDPASSAIPIILVTALGDAEGKVRGLEAGANDFLAKPPDQAELLARVRTLLRLKRSREELLSAKARTELLYDVGRQLSAELDLDTLLSRILELTIESIGATRGSIILLDERGRALRNIFSHQGKITSVTQQVREKILQEGLAGWVVRQRQGAILPDARKDSRWIAIEDSHAAAGSVIAVPLVQQERIAGVLTLTHEQVNRFAPSDLEILSSIASQAAVAIEKARAYMKEQLWARKLQFVSGVGHHVTSLLDPAQILEDAAWLISQTFDYYYVQLALLEDEELVFSSWNSSRGKGGKTPPARLPISDESIVPWVAGHADPLLALDVHQEPRYHPIPELPDTVAELAVPLQAGGKVLGVLDVQSDRYDQLSEEEIPLMEILASQVAIALANAQLFKTVERERGRLKAILSGTADAIVAADSEMRITLLNPAAEQAFGVPFSQMAGQPVETLPHEGLREAFRKASAAAGPIPPVELSLPGGRTLFCSISPVAAGPKGEKGWVSVMQDITHLKQLDRMKSDFVSTVSHDLRSPLSVIRGYADMLVRLTSGDLQEYAGHIANSSEHMSELISDLLDLGKIEAGVEETRVPWQLEKVVQEAVEMASFQAQLRQVKLTATIPHAVSPIVGDPQRLRQVMDNFLSNALKYTPAGGTVTVRVREEENRVLVEVQDTGIGIPRQALPRLFGKFYRVPRPETANVPGTGLGLAIVKAIVESHGGQVWVESEIGEGSTFGFSLPASDQAPPAAQRVQKAQEDDSRGRGRRRTQGGPEKRGRKSRANPGGSSP